MSKIDRFKVWSQLPLKNKSVPDDVPLLNCSTKGKTNRSRCDHNWFCSKSWFAKNEAFAKCARKVNKSILKILIWKRQIGRERERPTRVNEIENGNEQQSDRVIEGRLKGEQVRTQTIWCCLQDGNRNGSRPVTTSQDSTVSKTKRKSCERTMG